MVESPQNVGPLMKIHLVLDITDAEDGGEVLRQVPLSFIFGIGREGLTPLEMALNGKQTGDFCSTSVGAGQLCVLFGRLWDDLRTVAGSAMVEHNRPCRVEAMIADLAPADDRELIKAMARMSGGDCGGECGCGCGG